MYLIFSDLYSVNNPGSLDFSGEKSWVYYLVGSIFLVLTLINLFYCWKYKNTRQEYENIINSFGTFKKFWYQNRFLFFVLTSIISLISSIIFFMMNSVFLE